LREVPSEPVLSHNLTEGGREPRVRHSRVADLAARGPKGLQTIVSQHFRGSESVAER
jgi:hypothetical protein